MAYRTILSLAIGVTTFLAALPGHAQALSDRERALHALHRLGYGPRPGDLDRVIERGVDRWIADQLDPQTLPDPAVGRLMASYSHLLKSPEELRAEFPPAAVVRRANAAAMALEDSAQLTIQLRGGRAFVSELLSARVARAVAAERQLDEVMADFWLNHFNVFVGKSPRLRYTLPSYEADVIRPHLWGTFRDLLGAVAKSPAMLLYLDNAVSVADSTRPTLVDRRVGERRMALARRAVRTRTGPGVDSAQLEQVLARRPQGLNENYARELLELHTMGVDGGYTQADVIEVARALTGWTVRPGRDDGFAFNPVTHDAGAKRILGANFPSGRGQDEGERVLDLLARHPETARYIAGKLAVRFVADEPPATLVDRAAEVFLATDGNIREVVRTIVTSQEFFAREAWRAKVKSPFEVAVSAVRALGGTPDPTALSAALVAQLGQPIYGHQAPNGWPETGDAWMNSGAILARINFGMQVGANRVPGVRLTAWPLHASLVGEPREAQVAGIIDALLGGAVSPETRDVLSVGRNPLLDAPGTDADTTAVVDLSVMGVASPTGRREARTGVPQEGRSPGRRRSLPGLDGLALLVALAIGSPEFQRR